MRQFIAVIIIAIFAALCIVIALTVRSIFVFSEDLGNGCPSEPNTSGYSRSIIYDRTIRIEGSPEFIGRTVTALNRIRNTIWYRYAKALHRIVGRSDNAPQEAIAWLSRETVTAYVLPEIARETCAYFASVIIHEGSHALGQMEHGAYTNQAAALRDIGESSMAYRVEMQVEQFRNQ